MVSRSAEYALRSAACLAQAFPQPLTTRQIADAAAIPNPYLSKVLGALVRAGIIRSNRGLHGGFSLRRQPRELTLLEIVQTVDPSRRITCCPLGMPAHKDLCPLHRRLDDAAALLERSLSGATLADLTRGGEHACCCGSEGDHHD